MTPYTKTEWQDETPTSTPIKYKISQTTDGDVAPNAEIAIVTPVTAGTPVNATNLNHMEVGIENAQIAADAAQVTATAAIPKSLVTTIGDLIYATASATLARLAKPAVTAVLQMAAGGTPSWRAVYQTIEMQLVGDSDEVTTSIVKYFFIPSTLNGMNLVRAQAMVLTAGTTNATTIQVRNLTKYASNDALSTAISIASAGTVGTVGVVNTSYDDVSTNDKIKISVTGVSTTKPLGLWIVLEYQLP